MAEVKGFTCDVCGGFAAAASGHNLPENWMHVTIAAIVQRPASGFAEVQDLQPPRTSGFDICGNTCLTKLAVERVLASDEEKLPVGVTYREPGTGRGGRVGERGPYKKRAKTPTAEEVISGPLS